MAKPIKKIAPIGAQPTEEQKKEMAARAFVQKRNSIAEMTIANILHGVPLADIDPEGAPEVSRGIVDFALALADYYMQRAFGLPEEKPEEKPAQ